MYWAYLAALIDVKIQNKLYLKKNYLKDIYGSIETKSKEELIKDIQNMKK